MSDENESISYARFQAEPENGRQRLSRAARRGTTTRIARGAYLPTDQWASMDEREQYISRVVAVAATRRVQPVISHHSAAAIHGLPVLGHWPVAVHITQLPGAGGRSHSAIIKHSAVIPKEDLVAVGDLLVTSIERTVIDIAAISTFTASVVTADGALYCDELHGVRAMTTRARLFAALERALPIRAHARTTGVVAFAESRAQTAIESVSRVNMRVLKVPRPQLQVAHFDSSGFIATTDFAWEEFGAIGEADGARKYLDAAARGGRTPEQVLLDEKYREDRLRALPRKVARWPWAVALDPARLRVKLKILGLPFNCDWELDPL